MLLSSHYQFNYQLLLWYFTRNWRRERKKQLEKKFVNMKMMTKQYVVLEDNK